MLYKCFNDVKFRVILVNDIRTGSFFSYKDSLPLTMQSSLVYNCRRARCTSEYVGSTVRALHSKVAEHCGRSSRTGSRVSSPPVSSMRNHANICAATISQDNFKEIWPSKNICDLWISKTLHILKRRPK